MDPASFAPAVCDFSLSLASRKTGELYCLATCGEWVFAGGANGVLVKARVESRVPSTAASEAVALRAAPAADGAPAVPEFALHVVEERRLADSDSISCLAVASAAQALALATLDGKLCFFSAADLRDCAVIETGFADVEVIDLADNGRSALFGSTAGLVSLAHRKRGLVWCVGTDGGCVTACKFVKDPGSQQTLAAAATSNGGFYLFAGEDGATLFSKNFGEAVAADAEDRWGGGVRCLEAADDLLALGLHDGSVVLLTISTRKVIGNIDNVFSYSVERVVFCAAHRGFWCAADSSGKVAVFQDTQLRLSYQHGEGEAFVTHVFWSGWNLVSVAADCTARVVDGRDATEYDLLDTESLVNAAALLPLADRTLLLAACDDARLRGWLVLAS